MNATTNQLDTVLRTRSLPDRISAEALLQSIETLLGTSAFVGCSGGTAAVRAILSSAVDVHGGPLYVPATLPASFLRSLDLQLPIECIDLTTDLRPATAGLASGVLLDLGPTGRSGLVQPSGPYCISGLLGTFVSAQGSSDSEASRISFIGDDLGIPALEDVVLFTGAWTQSPLIQQTAVNAPLEPWQLYGVAVLLSRWLSGISDRRTAARTLQEGIHDLGWLGLSGDGDPTASACVLKIFDSPHASRAPYVTPLQRALLRTLRVNGIRARTLPPPLTLIVPELAGDPQFGCTANQVALEQILIPWNALSSEDAVKQVIQTLRSFNPEPHSSYARFPLPAIIGANRFGRILRTKERSWPVQNDLAGRRFRRELAVLRDVSDSQLPILLGSGDGRHLLPLVRLGLTIDGFDYRLNELEAAEEEWFRRGGSPDVLRMAFADLRRLPFADATVDVVLLPRLDDLDEPALVLQEALRVLAPEGTLVLGFRNRSSLHAHGRGLSLKMLKPLIDHHGVTVVQQTGFGLLCSADDELPQGVSSKLAARLGDEFGGLTVDEVISSQPWALPFAAYHLYALKKGEGPSSFPIHHGERRYLDLLSSRSDVWNAENRDALRGVARDSWASGDDAHAVDIWLSLLRECPDDPALLLDLARVSTVNPRMHRLLDRFEVIVQSLLPLPAPEPEPEPEPAVEAEFAPEEYDTFPQGGIEHPVGNGSHLGNGSSAKVAMLSSAETNGHKEPAIEAAPKIRFERDSISGTVSIIFPMTGSSPLFRKTIESILYQQWKKFELLIVPWAIRPEIEQYLQSLNDPRVVVLTNKVVSRAEALNFGLERSRGEFVTWVAGGTIYSPEWLGLLLEALTAYHGAGFAYGAMGWHDSAGEQQRPAALPPFSYPTLLTKRPLIGAFLYRRAIHQECGRYDVTMSDVEDWEMWLRVQRTQRIVGVVKQLCTVPSQGDGVPRSRILELGKKIINRELTRTGGRLELELLYPGVSRVEDIDTATWHALLDLGGRFIDSEYVPAAEAVTVLEQAASFAPDHPLVLTNLLVALIRADRNVDAGRIADRLRSLDASQVSDTTRTLLNKFRELGTLPAELLRSHRLSDSESELMRCEREMQLRYRPSEGGGEAAHP